jgi:hypothetical protein
MNVMGKQTMSVVKLTSSARLHDHVDTGTSFQAPFLLTIPVIVSMAFPSVFDFCHFLVYHPTASLEWVLSMSSFSGLDLSL